MTTQRDDGGATAIRRAGEREMRTRAIDAAHAAYPNPDAMMRAIAAIPVDADPIIGRRLALEPAGSGAATLVRGDKRVALSGGNLARILAMHGHLMTHGATWADTYLAGVADGLGHAAVTQLEDVMDGIKRNRAEREAPKEEG